MRLTTVLLFILLHGVSAGAQGLADDGAGQVADTVSACQPARYAIARPRSWQRPYSWGLHEGLNLSLSASVMAGFGKHAPHGAGFAETLSATYLEPLSDRLELAVGGYVSNLSWGGSSGLSAGVYGALSYKIDEHWEAYIYGQKNFHNSSTPAGYRYGFGYWPAALYGLGSPIGGAYMGAADRLGAGVRYNFSPSFSVEVNVEQVWLPTYPGALGTGGWGWPARFDDAHGRGPVNWGRSN